jgi:hypothetical protein
MGPVLEPKSIGLDQRIELKGENKKEPNMQFKV